MKRIITSFRRANKDLLNYITEEFPNGVDDEALINFPKAGGGSIRALEIEMEDTLYLVRMEDEEYYQKYLAKDDDDEDSDEDLDDVDMDDLESSDADDED